jgi:O-succinylbenzoate synthase
LIDLEFSDSVPKVLTAQGKHRNRPLVWVRLSGRANGVLFEGWGECAALADTTYDPEDAAGAFIELESSLIPALNGVLLESGGRLPVPSALPSLREIVKSGPLGFAALEMAVTDAHLRAEGRSLAHVLGVEGRDVPIGVVAGQFGSVDELVREVVRSAERGFARVKLKIGPGWDVEPLRAIRAELPELPLQVDANGSYGREEISHLRKLDQFELRCIEQPFDRNDLESHRLLSARIDTPVCLDEGIDSVKSARHALDMRACSAMCVKPARLGGMGAALELIQICTDAQIPLWMGGMFESGYARSVNTTLAALPGFVWTGDLSPAHWYLAEDPAPAPDPTRSGPNGTLSARPLEVAGLGNAPDLEILERHTVTHRTVALGGR